MKTFTRSYKINRLEETAFDRYFGKLKPCVFDIETTGLSPENSKVILTAMLIPDEAGVTVTQFFAEDSFEEDLVLGATMRFMEEENVGYLITYNGASFDIPFVNRRLDVIGLPYRLSKYDFDIWRFLKKHSTLPSILESMSQKRVEHYFGIGSNRYDKIDGRQSIRLYNEYVKTGNSVLEKVILTHNREDVVQLYKILLAAGYNDFGIILKEGTFHRAIQEYSFPILAGSLTARPRLMNKELRVAGRQISEPVNAVLFPDNENTLKMELKKPSSGYEASLPIQKRGKSVFIDLAIANIDEDLAEALRLRELSGFVNDYLILADEGLVYHEEINALSEILVTDAYNKLVK